MNEFGSAFQAITVGGAGVWTLVFMLAVTLVRGWPKLKELQTQADGSLRHDLLQEIARLRAEILIARAEAAAERVSCDAKVAAMELKHEQRVALMEDALTKLRLQVQALTEGQGPVKRARNTTKGEGA